MKRISIIFLFILVIAQLNINPVISQKIVPSHEVEIKLNSKTSFKVEYQSDNLFTDIVTSDKNKTWSNSKEELKYYELPETEQYTRGYEYEIVLKEKPLSNQFTFNIDSDNLAFYYQPALTEEIFPKDYTVNETHVLDENGTLSIHRPINVVGSYAVYDSIRDSKVMHIYRPNIIDAGLNEIWGNMSIKDGVLTITISQAYLDKAIYPVIIDPTFGYTTIGGSTDDNPWGNVKVAWRYKNRVGDGNVTNISVYGRAVTTNGSMRAGIYIANEVYPYIPTTLKGSSSEILVNTTLQWYHFPIDAYVYNNTEYYLTIHRKAGFSNFRNYYDAGIHNQAIQDADTYADGLSDPFDALGDFDWNYTRKGTIYANVTANPLLINTTITVNNYLGQFMDNFTSLGNVSVIKDVVRNSTYNAMELNYSSGIPSIEDLTTWTETDVEGDIVVTSSTAIVTSERRDSDALIYKNYGVGYFNDFILNFTYVMIGNEAGDASNVVAYLPIAVGNGTTRDELYANESIVIEMGQNGATDNRLRYVLRQRKAGAWTIDIKDTTYYAPATHYITLFRSGTNVTLNVYSDSARTTLLEHLSSNSGDLGGYQYGLAGLGYSSLGDPADHGTYNISDIDIGGVVSGYVSNGYFTTTNYMNDTYANGTALVLMTNATIPTDTGITVEFSNDNSTWTNTSTLTDGFRSHDLRILNYSVIYFRYNLTTSNIALTPRLYQSRLITTSGIDPVGGGGIFGINSATILMLILLLILGIGLYVGVKK
jgi:hypothetical protein